jgi:hypothetical protein
MIQSAELARPLFKPTNSLNNHIERTILDRCSASKFVLSWIPQENKPNPLFSSSRILRNDSSENKLETNEIHLRHQRNHLSFLQSILLSSMINPASSDREDGA